MLRATGIRCAVGAWLVVSLVVALAGPAAAKGAQDATLTGTDYAVFRTEPSPLEPHRPRGRLGPRYMIVYRLYAGENDVTPVRQILCPFARAGFVTYTPRGQHALHQKVRSGWYTSAVQPSPVGGGMPSQNATALFVSVGVPDRRPSS